VVGLLWSDAIAQSLGVPQGSAQDLAYIGFRKLWPKLNLLGHLVVGQILFAVIDQGLFGQRRI